MALTRMSWAPNSMAQTRVIMISPALVKLLDEAAALGAQSGDGGDIDNAASAASLDHGRHDEADKAERGEHVDFGGFEQGFVRYFQCRALADVGGRVIHEDIDGPELSCGLRDEAFEFVFPADVANDGNGTAGKGRRTRRRFA